MSYMGEPNAPVVRRRKEKGKRGSMVVKGEGTTGAGGIASHLNQTWNSNLNWWQVSIHCFFLLQFEDLPAQIKMLL
jgi:hypothetical protein